MSNKRRGGGKPTEQGGRGREQTVSKALSYLLRHAAEKEGLKMNAQGYANVADVVRKTRLFRPGRQHDLKKKKKKKKSTGQG